MTNAEFLEAAKKYSEVQKLINEIPSNFREKFSDGYHSFEELYEFRKFYNAMLFNEWGKQISFHINDSKDLMKRHCKYDVHKSWRHHDGELCFGGEWFIVVAMLPTGQISHHYKFYDWDLFQIPAEEKAKYPFDGHTSKDVIERIKKLNPENPLGL